MPTGYGVLPSFAKVSSPLPAFSASGRGRFACSKLSVTTMAPSLRAGSGPRAPRPLGALLPFGSSRAPLLEFPPQAALTSFPFPLDFSSSFPFPFTHGGSLLKGLTQVGSCHRVCFWFLLWPSSCT